MGGTKLGGGEVAITMNGKTSAQRGLSQLEKQPRVADLHMWCDTIPCIQPGWDIPAVQQPRWEGFGVTTDNRQTTSWKHWKKDKWATLRATWLEEPEE